jgi:hypothetical protein
LYAILRLHTVQEDETYLSLGDATVGAGLPGQSWLDRQARPSADGRSVNLSGRRDRHPEAALDRGKR